MQQRLVLKQCSNTYMCGFLVLVCLLLLACTGWPVGSPRMCFPAAFLVTTFLSIPDVFVLQFTLAVRSKFIEMDQRSFAQAVQIGILLKFLLNTLPES